MAGRKKNKKEEIETLGVAGFSFTEEATMFIIFEVKDPVSYVKLLTDKLSKYDFFIKSKVIDLDTLKALMNDTYLLK